MNKKGIFDKTIVTFFITYLFFTQKSIKARILTTIQTNNNQKNLSKNSLKSVFFDEPLILHEKNGQINSLEKYIFVENSDKSNKSETISNENPEAIPIKLEPDALPICKNGDHWVWLNSIQRIGLCARDFPYQCRDYNIKLGWCKTCYRHHTLQRNNLYENYCSRNQRLDFWEWFWYLLATCYIIFTQIACCYCIDKCC